MTTSERIEENIYLVDGRYIVQLQRGFPTLREAQEYKNQLRQQGLLKKAKGTGRPIKHHENRYIHIYKHPNITSYAIQKKIDGKIQHYGTYHNLQDAREERDFLESIDWDYSNMETVESLEYQENKEKWRRAINE